MSAISPGPLSGANISSSPSTRLRWPLSDSAPDDFAIEIDRESTRGRLRERNPVKRIAHDFGRAIARRWRRERRRRKIGRAYDMALEIARVIPRGSDILDVGCGNGYIAHHLSGMLNANVTGIDLAKTTEALIDYRQFDGASFPVKTGSVDAILFCYVLHHAQDICCLLSEVRRTLRDGGTVVIYEDIPDRAWDRVVCGIHNRKWKSRTGPCTFRCEREWCEMFATEGFEVCHTRRLSRWRNLAHPVSRRRYVLRLGLQSRMD